MSAHSKIQEAVDELRLAQKALGAALDAIKRGAVFVGLVQEQLEEVDDKIFNAISHLGE